MPGRAPSGPTGLTARVQSETITVKWSMPTDTGGSLITGYQVRYHMNGGGWGNWMTAESGERRCSGRSGDRAAWQRPELALHRRALPQRGHERLRRIGPLRPAGGVHVHRRGPGDRFHQPDLHHPPGGPGPVTIPIGSKPKRGNRTSGCPFFLEWRLSCRPGAAVFLPPVGVATFLSPRERSDPSQPPNPGVTNLATKTGRLEIASWGAAFVRQANWHKIGGESPLKRKDIPSTFLREPYVNAREGVGEASVLT